MTIRCERTANPCHCNNNNKQQQQQTTTTTTTATTTIGRKQIAHRHTQVDVVRELDSEQLIFLLSFFCSSVYEVCMCFHRESCNNFSSTLFLSFPSNQRIMVKLCHGRVVHFFYKKLVCKKPSPCREKSAGKIRNSEGLNRGS